MTAPARPIERHVAREAALWFLKLQRPSATAEDVHACLTWRQRHSDHERAWQLAERFNQHVQAIPPAVARSTLPQRTTLSRRHALKALTTLVVLGSVGLASSRTSTVTALMADVSTGVGERRVLTLADGTSLYLNTDTALDVQFTEESRILVLKRGEILVATGRDPAPIRRPFSVESKRGLYHALGTRFTVRLYDDDDSIRVMEGAVSVRPRLASNESLRLDAGQQATVTERTVTRQPANATVSWVDGVLHVEQMRLDDFVAELGRYRAGWTRCDPEVADLLISGTFQLDDIDAALAAVALTQPVQVHYRTRYWVTLSRA